jgi:hypothetical protein
MIDVQAEYFLLFGMDGSLGGGLEEFLSESNQRSSFVNYTPYRLLRLQLHCYFSS